MRPVLLQISQGNYLYVNQKFGLKNVRQHQQQSLCVLKSITLPKVTTVGDRGFWACYYLETLTFGSVVTAINDNSGEVFYDLGYQIGGCHLVLNKDQGNVEGLAPELANNTWAGYTWKSITLK